jgi:streptogramin lyase/photosystem II stability/assembly factor-like uncharacterized protein
MRKQFNRYLKRSLYHGALRTIVLSLFVFLFSGVLASGTPPVRAFQDEHATVAGSTILKQSNIPTRFTSGNYSPHTFLAGAWIPLGPQPIQTAPGASGRITSIADDVAGNIWVGAADGGVWHSSDGGTSWLPMTDTQPTLSIGSIAIDRVNPFAIYVGTGEGNLTQHGFGGVGILKSVDGGKTWAQLAPQFANLGIPKIAIDPNNHLNLLAAVDPNDPMNMHAHKSPGSALTNMGIWRSTDGGQTWTQAVSDGPGGPMCDGGTDVLFDPTHPSVAFAGLGNVLNCPSGSHAGVYISTDSGATWNILVQKNAGMPTGRAIYRVSLGFAALGAGLNAYAALTDGGSSVGGKTYGDLLNGKMYVSTDSGMHWQGKNVPSAMASDGTLHQWDYNSVVAVDPTNQQTAYAGGVNLWQTQDGGTTWNDISQSVHEDQHALTFLPGSSSNFYLGNDGGVWSGTRTGAFTNLNGNDPQGHNLNITQFYSGSIGEKGTNAQLYGGAQDNFELQYPAGPVSTAKKWNLVDIGSGGDGGYMAVDYMNNAIVYGERVQVNNGHLFRAIAKSTDGGSSWADSYGTIPISTETQNFFDVPLVMSPSHSNDLVVGYNHVYHSTDGGTSWTDITQQPWEADAVSAIGLAPSQGYVSYIYVGFNSGAIRVTTDGGAHWHLSSSPPQPIMVSGLAVDPANPNVAYVTYPTFSTPGGKHVYRTTDAGITWTDISLSMPNIPAESVLVTHTSPGLVIVGTDAGIFSSSNNGNTWDTVGSGLPNVVIDQIFTNHQGTKLFVATHGRGMWEMPLHLSKITEYPLPSGSAPDGITDGPDGNLWFTENNSDQIGKITTAGAITEYPLSSTGNFPTSITDGPDGNLWFTEQNGNKIGKITTAGAITEFTLPSGSAPDGITAGPDGNLWFTENGGNKIGKITPAGAITAFTLSTGSGPFGITAGSDGNLWFTEKSGNKIGKITTAGAITEYPILTSSNSYPFGITAGPDGNLWFTENNGDKIGKITTAGTITEYTLPSAGFPFGITAGPDGNLWFLVSRSTGHTIGKITPTGIFTEYLIPTTGDTLSFGITDGSDGNLWFTENQNNMIGKLTP